MTEQKNRDLEYIKIPVTSHYDTYIFFNKEDTKIHTLRFYIRTRNCKPFSFQDKVIGRNLSF